MNDNPDTNIHRLAVQPKNSPPCTPPPVMNVPLLRRIQKSLDKNPELFEMQWWSSLNDCGTAYCIGGWGCFLSGIDVRHIPEWTLLNLFGLTGDQARRLFNERQWPVQFQRDIWLKIDLHPFADEKERHRVRKSGEHAALGIARIEHFIQTNGEE